jgi:hypothetical protein
MTASKPRRKDRWNTRQLLSVSIYWLGRHFKPLWRLAADDSAAGRQGMFNWVHSRLSQVIEA